jgi:NAD-dependent DNA ligase
MYSQGIPGFGKGQIKPLKEWLMNHSLETGSNLSPFRELEKTVLESTRDGVYRGIDWRMISGIGITLSMALNQWITKSMFGNDGGKFTRLLTEVNIIDEIPIIKDIPDNGIKGKTFCITGGLESFTNRDEAFKFIIDNGGKTSTSVSSKTDYLVNNDPSSGSSKNKKAAELGIPVITEKELINLAAQEKQEELEQEDEYER